jgi:hypothetical protein
MWAGFLQLGRYVLLRIVSEESARTAGGTVAAVGRYSENNRPVSVGVRFTNLRVADIASAEPATVKHSLSWPQAMSSDDTLIRFRSRSLALRELIGLFGLTLLGTAEEQLILRYPRR